MDTSFPKSYRLKSRKEITKLYQSGKKVYHFPYIVYYNPIPEQQHPTYAFSVPKKQFKKAVMRNRIKRLLVETVRLFHPEITEEMKSLFSAQFLILYIADKELPLSTLKKKWSQVIKKLETSESVSPE